MDPNSSLGKIFFGDNVIEISSDKIEGSRDWNSPEYQDTAGNKGKKVMNALSFYRMETDEISEQYIAPCFVHGLEAYDGEVNLEFDENLISNEFAVKLCLDYEFIINPEEDDFELGVILGRSFLRLAKGVIDFVWKNKLELDGKIVKEEEEAVQKIKGEALKEKDDPGAFIFPIRLDRKVNENALADTGSDINTMLYQIFETLGREDMKKVDRGIMMINHSQAEAMGKLSDVLCSILNALERIFSTFDGICHQTFRVTRFDVLRTAESDSDDEEEYVIKRNKFRAPIYGLRPAPYQNCTNPKDRSSAIQTTLGTYDGEAGSSRSKRPRQHETVEELYNTRLAQLLPRHIYSPCIVNWDVLHQMGYDGEIDDMLRIRVREAESEEEFYVSFDLYLDDDIGSKKFTKFSLGDGGLHNDDNFNAQDYWLSISQEENISLSRSHTSTIRNPILRVIYKMITYGLCQRITGYDKVQKNDLFLLSMFDARHQNGYANVPWVIARWMKRKGVGTQKESQICRGQFISKLARKCRVLTEDVPGVPRVGIPRPPRASMQNLYDRMGRMEICQDAIKRMKYS
ncbi:hypothetical protein Tco_0496350 [Tanacetum coccineum]